MRKEVVGIDRSTSKVHVNCTTQKRGSTGIHGSYWKHLAECVCFPMANTETSPVSVVHLLRLGMLLTAL